MIATILAVLVILFMILPIFILYPIALLRILYFPTKDFQPSGMKNYFPIRSGRRQYKTVL